MTGRALSVTVHSTIRIALEYDFPHHRTSVNLANLGSKLRHGNGTFTESKKGSQQEAKQRAFIPRLKDILKHSQLHSELDNPL